MRRWLMASGVGALLGLAWLDACSSFSASADGTVDASSPPDATSEEPFVADASGESSADALADTTVEAALDGGCGPNCRVVFVTSAQYDGQLLGGFAGGDAKCKQLADAVPKLAGLKWDAWLSTPDSAVKSRISMRAGQLALVNGIIVATSVDGLLRDELSSPIEYNENGAPVSPSTAVWTGTDYGDRAGLTCNGWTALGPENSGTVGLAGAKDQLFTNKTAQACVALSRLYCIQR